MKKILVITHEVSRTGSPLVVLNFLEWLKHNHSEQVVDILSLNGGALESSFRKLCRNYYDYKNSIKPNRVSFLKRILLKFNLLNEVNYKQNFLEVLSKNNYDLIYANSIPSLSVAVSLKELNNSTPLVLHVHELNTVMKMYLNSSNKKSLNYVNRFIAVSNLVKYNLIENWEVDTNRIDVIYEFSKIKNLSLKKKSNVFTVGASGTVERRKGDDVFLQIARFIKKNIPKAKIEFVWVGRNEKANLIEADIKKMNLKGMVKFIGEQTDPFVYYNNFDIFLMTSREDPFPLVCIEVANLNIPIICFDKATGTQEIIANGGGEIVPYLDVESMGEQIIEYYNNREKLIADGKKAKQLFAQFVPENICPQIYTVIQQQMSL